MLLITEIEQHELEQQIYTLYSTNYKNSIQHEIVQFLIIYDIEHSIIINFAKF